MLVTVASLGRAGLGVGDLRAGGVSRRALDAGLFVPVTINGMPHGRAICKGLRAVDRVDAMTSAGMSSSALYACRVGLLGRVFDVRAFGVPMGSDGPFQVVIGRDVLRHGRLVYDGPADRFELTFP